MSYLILCDSCTDFTENMKQDPHFAHIPLTIHIGDYDIIDDDTFDQQDFLRRIDAYPECAKSSCPAPDEYLKHFEMADDIYMVTLSSHLSGSYNSAMLAANMYMEDHPNKHIHVFDSFIHVDSSIEWAQDNSVPVSVYKKSTRSAKEFQNLAKEVMDYGSR